MLLRLLCVLVVLARSAVALADEGTCNVDVSTRERLKRIGANVLNQMGLSEPPENPKVPVFVPPEKEAEFHALQESIGTFTETVPCAEPAGFAREKKTFLPIEAKALPSNPRDYVFHDNEHVYGKRDLSSFYRHGAGIPPSSTYKLTFNLDLTNEKMFSSAELVIYKKLVTPQTRNDLTDFETVQVLLVYKKYYYHLKHLVADEMKEIIETRILSTSNEEYVSFNVTTAVRRWLEIKKVSAGEISLEVLIRCPELLSSYKILPPLIEFDIGQQSGSNNTAILSVSILNANELSDMSSNGRRRSKRQIPRLDSDFCFQNPGEPNCCVRELTVNFEKDLGYGWIMSPKEYHPNYCTGFCPSYWPSISENTVFIQAFRVLNPTEAVEPCCAPEKIKPIVIMFTINGELILQRMNNMEVDNCICR